MNSHQHNKEHINHSHHHHHHHHEHKSEQKMKHNHNHHSSHNGHDHHGHMTEDFKKRFWISLFLTIPILLTSHMFLELVGLHQIFQFEGDIYVHFVLSSIVFFYGGYPFLKGLRDEMKALKPGMMTLIALAILVAYIYSTAVVFGLPGDVFYWELATLIVIMLLGHWIEMKSVMSASKALEELAELLPSEAHKIDVEGNVNDVPVKSLLYGDKILIKPGEKVPADGEIYEGRTSINEAMITGESKPVEKFVGSSIIGGSINGEGSIKIIVRKTGDETFISQVVKMVKEAQASKSKTQNLANRAAFWLTIIAIIAGFLTLFSWLLIAGESFHFALSRTVTVMVITCPHALGLAIPLVIAVSTALSAKSGLLIRNRTAFENARNIKAILFDKTGTLTKGEFGVSDVIVFNSEITREELLKLAASIESESEHSIAKGIVKAVDEKYEVKDFISIPGKGAEGKVNGKKIYVVSLGYLKENNISLGESFNNFQKMIGQLLEEGKTVVYVVIDDKIAGAIALADIIRKESKGAIEKLKQMGINPIMITGDNSKVAKWVADKLNLAEYFAEVLPEKKADKVKEVQRRGLVTAMVGDGVNDAPALAQADVGIAIGAGTDVAVETADIVLVRNNPEDVVSLIKFARVTYKKMVENLLWATGYNVIAIPLAAGVLYSYGIILSPAVGAVLMSLSTIIVAINARLLKV
jgi:Cu2+-exporting ATPase